MRFIVVCEYSIYGGETGFDSRETKLPTYWNTSFSKICLGMKIGNQTNFVSIDKQAKSLYSLIGQFLATSLGRDTWKTLIGSQTSLPQNCNKEGFIVASTSSSHLKGRIGFLSNNENECDSADSRIGFGTGHPGDTNTCGHEAGRSAQNGDKHIKTVTYILVQ